MWHPHYQQIMMARLMMAARGVPQGAASGAMAGFPSQRRNPVYQHAQFQAPHGGGGVASGGAQQIAGHGLLSAAEMQWLIGRAGDFNVELWHDIPDVQERISKVARLAGLALVGSTPPGVANPKLVAAITYASSHASEWGPWG